MDVNQLDIITDAVVSALDIVEEPDANFVVLTVDEAGVNNIISSLDKTETEKLLATALHIYQRSIKEGMN